MSATHTHSTATEKAIEARLRRLAHRKGYYLQKSRTRNIHINDCGRFMIVDFRNVVYAGVNFELTLDDVESYLSAASPSCGH